MSMSDEAREDVTRLTDQLWDMYRNDVAAARDIAADDVSDFSDDLLAIVAAAGGDIASAAVNQTLNLISQGIMVVSYLILSAILSPLLTLVAVMCGLLLKPEPKHGRFYLLIEGWLEKLTSTYKRCLTTTLAHKGKVLIGFVIVLGLNAFLFKWRSNSL